MKESGFSLMEMLVALAVSSVLLVGAARVLPALQCHNLQTLMRFQLHEEIQLMMARLQKAVIRAGYCKGECAGAALHIAESGRCFLVRWDENSNGRWEGTGSAESDLYGYRFRQGSLEMQRGVDNCEGSGWERLNDPATVMLSDFHIIQHDKQIRLAISAFARAFPRQSVTLERWITAGNL
ncbi:prepilin peptidase-dependent protein [Erwinia sp. MMLR14_017]|uniref:prepilin peptidase-dependent protein n=1 Tax=Erwinia sp. MMLR14_017 TaxID=3093842 RepID=UPI00299016C4|nr:prepilin peptidase-dependent protein [Erwinia sp. MMLR14_017]MDW8845646.1 prepilin peptidase-dependent protein [Erwinia sp. MMLR14_017]